ncbi:MAG: 50S ribosomal protein L7ae-like protein [Firmicutes bacterium]|nr:50S ribosomal protein L7ae-like protein [Bacillota bacterium]MTI70858.1 50S ribosomal protein L7ae-like protein [Bacillota bacterium]
MLSELKNCKKVIGTKQAKRALLDDNAKLIYIAKDAESHVVNKIKELSKSKSVEIVLVDTMRDLGKACGIDVSAASVAIIKTE